jgi:hypothetical protein
LEEKEVEDEDDDDEEEEENLGFQTEEKKGYLAGSLTVTHYRMLFDVQVFCVSLLAILTSGSEI